MKHEKEWYECDRCGKEISNADRSFLVKSVYRIKGVISHRFDFYSVGRIDLCPDCAKDFERFMKNEEIKK